MRCNIVIQRDVFFRQNFLKQPFVKTGKLPGLAEPKDTFYFFSSARMVFLKSVKDAAKSAFSTSDQAEGSCAKPPSGIPGTP
jgi:hypothetical protein